MRHRLVAVVSRRLIARRHNRGEDHSEVVMAAVALVRMLFDNIQVR